MKLSYNALTALRNDIAQFTEIRFLDLNGNQLSDISGLASLKKLNELFLKDNQITDLSALVTNTELGKGDTVYITGNPLDCESDLILQEIEALEARHVSLYDDCN